MNDALMIHYSKEAEVLRMSEQKFANLFFINVGTGGEAIPLIFDSGASLTVISD